LNRPAIVAANKVDLLSRAHGEELLFQLAIVAEDSGIRFSGDVMGISAGVTGEGLGSLSKTIRTMVQQREAELLVEDFELSSVSQN
jgi:50S ribosomal subunit-associated GTPase HflX